MIVLADRMQPPPDEDEDEDLVKILFDRGIPFLRRHGVQSDNLARSLIGKWRKMAKQTGEGDMAVYQCFAECKRLGITDPRAWITAALSPKADPADELKSVFASAIADLRAEGILQ